MKSIGVDVDGSLADIHGSFVQDYNRKYEDNISVEDIDHWMWPYEVVGKKEFLEMTETIWSDREIDPLCSPEEFARLTEQYRVHIVTARYHGAEHIEEWLKNNGFTGYSSFRFDVSDKSSLGLDEYFDDNPNMADSIDSDQQLHLFNQPWNRNVGKLENVNHVRSLDDVVKFH